MSPTAVRGHIPWSTVDDRLRAGRSIWLASTRPDGRPHAMPVWFWWDGDADPPRCYFQTARPTQKARNLAAQAAVVLHLGDGDDVVMLLGNAVVVDRRSGERARVDGAYRTKYVDPYTGARASLDENPLDDLYRVIPDRVIAWSYGVVGTWTEWRISLDTDSGRG
jgi:nitroimidazol reductase NimA-like FMN-containing flavoprotein (pyridoxamine 5'-phosphate oxidase superfamily)